MKKSVFFSLILMLFSAVFFCACSGENAALEETTSPAQREQTDEGAAAVSATSATEESTRALTYEAEGFVKNGQFVDYFRDGECLTAQGVDVSEFNGEVDFEAVKAAGVDFVMVRLGGRGYGESGSLYADDRALENIKAAKAAGLKVGGYFFSQAVTAEEAEEEASYALSLLSGESLDMPIAFDWETIPDDTARTDNLTDEALTACARAFCDEIKNAGYSSVIYAKQEVFARYDREGLSDCGGFWYSEFADAPSVTEGFVMWQYSESAEIDGIGTADLNLRFLKS